MRPVIIAIVGPSGSGKTTMQQHLQQKYGIPAIVSTTTRSRREGEVEGVDYFFVKNTRGFRRGDMLTHTHFGKHEYFSMKSQLPESGPCSYVVDEDGIRNLKRTAGKEHGVCTVLLHCDTDKLRERGIDPQRIEQGGRPTRLEAQASRFTAKGTKQQRDQQSSEEEQDDTAQTPIAQRKRASIEAVCHIQQFHCVRPFTRQRTGNAWRNDR